MIFNNSEEMFDNESSRYLEEKFKNIDKQFITSEKMMILHFENFGNKLESILEQTKKTNGRVTALESKIVTLEIDKNNHILNCPQTEKLKEINDKIDNQSKKTEEINKSLSEYYFFQKYPKLFIGIILVCLVASIVALKKSFGA